VTIVDSIKTEKKLTETIENAFNELSKETLEEIKATAA